MKRIAYFLFLILLCINTLHATYLTDVPCTRVQPNGDTLHCFASGDEFYHWLHDADGFTIIKNLETGYYVYADKVGDSLVPSMWVAGRVNPAEVGLTPRLTISAEQWRARRQQWNLPQTQAAQFHIANNSIRNTRSNNSSTINNIVIFIRFADDTPFTNSPTEVEAMFNDSTPGVNSMYNYFKTASYNQLQVHSHFYPTRTGNTILSYQDIHEHSYYEVRDIFNPNGYDENDNNERATREFALLERAIQAIANQVPTNLNLDYNNDGLIDNIIFVVRGNVGDWNTLLWPHKWALYDRAVYINGVRAYDFNFQLADNANYFANYTLCHEMGHTLGAPDFYHYYEGLDLAPVGTWDLMAATTDPPQQMLAYTKFRYFRWLDDFPIISTCGTYSLRSVGSSSTRNCYAIATSDPNEYIVVEYHNQNDAFESSLPGSGLLFYRLNFNFSGNANYNGIDIFDEMYIYRPFGSTTEDGQLYSAAFSVQSGRTDFHAGTNPQPFLTHGEVLSVGEFYIHDISEAGGDSMTFTLCYENFLQATPTNILIDAAANSEGTFQIESDMAWSISSSCDWLSFSPTTDNGYATVTVQALTTNSDSTARTCTLTIVSPNNTTQQVIVSQRGTEPYIILDAGTPVPNFYHQGDNITVTVSANCAWTASVNVDWVELSTTTGNENGEIMLSVLSENDNCIDRFVALTVSNSYGQSAILRFRQAHFSEGILAASPETITIGNEQAATATGFLSATDTWVVASKPTWVTVTPDNGVGSTEFTITTNNANINPSEQSSNITFSDVCGNNSSITITRGAGVLTVSPAEITLDAAAESTQTATITCNGDWRLIPISVPSWLTINPMNGDREMVVTITANSANAEAGDRTAAVVAKAGLSLSDTLHITQAGATLVPDLSCNDIQLFPNPVEEVLTVSVTTAQEYIIFNAQSMEIQRGTAASGENQISFSELPAGIYFMQFTDKNTLVQHTFKVVKR